MARENSKYMSVHFTKEQFERYSKLAAKCGLNNNALARLVAERMQPSDVAELLKRG